jgi:hypothetical protein
MTVTFSPANQAVVATPQDLITSALLEGGIIAQGEKLSQQDGAWGLEKLQRLTDQFNARRELIFSHAFTLYNLTPNHGPHTIGPAGDFNVPIRPVKIVSASFVLSAGSGNPVDNPTMNMRDAAWWAAVPLKSLTSAIVTDLYYEPSSPLGALNFYPICSGNNPVRLETWVSLAQAINLQTKLGFVQGYWDAIVLDLSIRLHSSYNRAVSPDLREQWNRAMKIIQANNDKPPIIDTSGGGLPTQRRGGRPDFNFLTGMKE